MSYSDQKHQTVEQLVEAMCYNPKVVGSIPDVVFQIFLGLKISGHIMTQHLTQLSKGKVPLLQERLLPRRWVKVQLYSSITTAVEGGGCSATRSGRNLHPGKTRYPLYRRLDGPQGRSGRSENLASPGFDPRTVRPVVSRYTDCATRPTLKCHKPSVILFHRCPLEYATAITFERIESHSDINRRSTALTVFQSIQTTLQLLKPACLLL